MKTECIAEQLEFHALGKREVIGKFNGGKISSDAGGILLREVEHRTHILKRLSECFIDHRKPELIEHSLFSLIQQRCFAIALGYEDLNDHDALRQDSLNPVALHLPPVQLEKRITKHARLCRISNSSAAWILAGWGREKAPTSLRQAPRQRAVVNTG